MASILVTGAAGFVGLHCVQYFSQLGYTVYGLHRQPQQAKTIADAGGTPIHADILKLKESHIPAVDIVIHAAAHLGKWTKDHVYLDVNVRGTKNVVDYALSNQVQQFIHISSDAVLFDGRHQYNLNESMPYPATPYIYARTKQQAEIIVNEVAQKMKTVILRPRIIWGPGDKTMLPLLIDAVQKNAFMWIGNGSNQINTTHIDNLLEAINLSINYQPSGETFFIHDGETISIKNFYKQLLAKNNLSTPTKSIPRWIALIASNIIEAVWKIGNISTRPPLTKFGAAVFSTNYTIDITKAEQELGYRPVKSINEGVNEL